MSGIALRRWSRRLHGDHSGMAAVEFALCLPVLIGMAAFAIELTNFAVVRSRVSTISLAAADSASRVGIVASSSSQQLREVDVNDVVAQLRLQGSRIGLTSNGRVTISSIRGAANGAQSMEWQRCVGLKRGNGWDSSYGTTTTTPFTGMGPTGQRVQAPSNSSAIFVEMNYEYSPLMTWFGSAKRKITYLASFIVRDNRIAGAPQATSGVTASTCSRWTT